MTPEIEFGEFRYPTLLQRMAAGDKGVAILLADDWMPMETYRPSRDYVFIKFGTSAMVGSIAVASRGWHKQSPWYGMKRGDIPLPIGDPYAWKPIPWIENGFASCRDYVDSIWPPEPPWQRPPEEIWEPAGIDVKLSPGPFELLRAMSNGALLTERLWEWSSWRLQRGPGQSEDKITHLPIGRLRGCAFIERIGTLPPGHPRRVLVYPWRVTDAGAAWLAANPNGWTKPARARVRRA